MRIVAIFLLIAVAVRAVAQSPNPISLAGELGGPKTKWAESELFVAGKPAVPAVLDVLQRGSTLAQVGAARTLGRIGDSSLNEFLVAAAKTGPQEVTDEAVVALCRVNPSRVRGQHGEAWVEKDVVALFMEIGPSALDGLLRGIADPRAGVRETAMEALRPHHDPKMIEPLARFARMHEQYGTWTCAKLLAQYDDARALAALSKVPSDPISIYGGNSPLLEALNSGCSFKKSYLICLRRKELVPFLLLNFDSSRYGVTIEMLGEFAKSPLKKVRGAAYIALGRTFNRDALRYLLKGLSRKDVAVREALFGLEYLKDPSTTKAVLDLYGPDDLGYYVIWAAERIDDGRYAELIKRLKDDYERSQAPQTPLGNLISP
jgi:HEAT repeat protein